MRSVVLNATARCAACALPDRWCICAAGTIIDSALRVDLLTHKREAFRPSSSGNLIKRVFGNTVQHIWQPEQPPLRDCVIQPEREVWLLHPNGLPPPANARPETVQAILLDGSWSEAAGIARTAGAWGRLVSLPLQGPSRFWLRAKHEGGRYSTAEALLFLLESLGLVAEHAALRLQFELHVYAHLRARGNTQAAALFLADTVIARSVPDFLAELTSKRANPAA